MKRNAFNIKKRGDNYYLYYANNFFQCKNAFRQSFFEDFGINTLKVNNIARKNSIEIGFLTKEFGRKAYYYFSKYEDDIRTFIDEINSAIIFKKFIR